MTIELSEYFGRLATAAQRLVDAELDSGARVCAGEVAAKVVGSMPPPEGVTQVLFASDAETVASSAPCSDTSRPTFTSCDR
jgi:hypothetical protein